VWGSQGRCRVGSWTGRKILLYLIMYRKSFRKSWLFNRNRIICPGVAANGQFLPGKSIFLNLPEKIEVFRKFVWKKSIFCVKLPE